MEIGSTSPVLQLPIHREHEHAFAKLDVDVRKDAENPGARDLAHLLAQLVPSLRNQILPQTLYHVDTFRSFCQLPLGRREDALEPHDDQITDNTRPYVVRPPAQEFLLELDDGVANGRFHDRSIHGAGIIGAAAKMNKRKREPFVCKRLLS